MYKGLKVNFDSHVNWQQATDLLRCSPLFHKHPRYDCVIVQTVNGFIFAQLILLFECTIDSTTYSFALIHPFDASIGRPLQRDVDLGFYRVRAKPRKSAEFISVRSVVRGALIVEDFAHKDDHLVINLIDTDMFLRLQAIFHSR